MVGNGKNDQIVEAPMIIITKEENIRMIDVKIVLKKLGTRISHSSSWKDEFVHAKQEMKSYIKKLMTADMKLHQV